MLIFFHGDILQAPTQAVINTVNTVGVMGKGLALAFKEAYPKNYKLYRAACEAGEVETGKMFVTETGKGFPKYLINFPTKKHWRYPSKMEYIEAGLIDLVQLIKEKEIQSIAVPPLGSGNGKLNWEEVRPLIEQYLSPLVDVEIVVYEPGYQAPPATLPLSKPLKLTPARTLLLAALSYYQEVGEELNLLVAQKLAYLLQRLGEPLKLSFEKGFYGPYAPILQKVLDRMNGQYLRFSSGTLQPNTEIRLLAETSSKIAEAFAQLDPEQQRRFASLQELIKGFESPFGLELLATVDFVRQNCPECSVEEVREDIHRWTQRKQSLMTGHTIQVTFEHLENNLSASNEDRVQLP